MAELTLYGLPMASIAGSRPGRAPAGNPRRCRSVQAALPTKVSARCVHASLLATTASDPASGLTTRSSRLPT